jgi:RHS repeat-associated protein
LPTRSLKHETRWYFGSSCERELIAGVTTQYIWIGGDAYTAVAVAKKVGTGAWTVYNIFRDHLGTITHLKNGTNPADEYSFDAWGRRRDKDDWTYTLTSEPALFADRGFTGHEYLEDFKLYNMNGRLYDPVVGRFLNADPFVQDPGFTQSMNRYSYCLNNPLKYSDPSGNTWWDKFWNWTAEHGIQFGINIGSGGPVPNISAPGPGNTRVAAGVNTQTGQFAIGNNSSGFTNFYYPFYDYNKVLKTRSSRYAQRFAAVGADLQSAPFSRGFVIPIFSFKRVAIQGLIYFGLKQLTSEIILIFGNNRILYFELWEH